MSCLFIVRQLVQQIQIYSFHVEYSKYEILQGNLKWKLNVHNTSRLDNKEIDRRRHRALSNIVQLLFYKNCNNQKKKRLKYCVSSCSVFVTRWALVKSAPFIGLYPVGQRWARWLGSVTSRGTNWAIYYSDSKRILLNCPPYCAVHSQTTSCALSAFSHSLNVTHTLHARSSCLSLCRTASSERSTLCHSRMRNPLMCEYCIYI